MSLELLPDKIPAFLAAFAINDVVQILDLAYNNADLRNTNTRFDNAHSVGSIGVVVKVEGEILVLAQGKNGELECLHYLPSQIKKIGICGTVTI